MFANQFIHSFCLCSNWHKIFRCFQSSAFNISNSKMSADLSAMRKPYCSKKETLQESDIGTDPFVLFHNWFETAKQNAQTHTEINAVCLTTATREGKPSSRMVLLKSYDPVNGFTIYTNYSSRKGREMQQNPNVALLFYWDFPRRQVRVEGRAEKVPAEVSDHYYSQRPKSSRISARISQQSQPIPSREAMLEKKEQETQLWANTDDIPRPDFWGGIHIVPERFEFWQGQSDRLHDRFIFLRQKDEQQTDKWSIQRLQP